MSVAGAHTELDTILSHPPCPSLIYLHHPHHPSTSLPPLPASCAAGSSSGSKMASTTTTSTSTLSAISIDTVEHHTPRLLLSGILCKITGDVDHDVNTFDAFKLVLRGWWMNKQSGSSGSGSGGKGKAKVRVSGNGTTDGNDGIDVNGHEAETGQWVVIRITKAERLRSVLGNGWSVITRLSELTGVPCTVILCSTAPWDHVRPHRGDAPEPVHIYLPPPTKEEIHVALLPGSSHPLYPRFLDLLLSTVLPLATPPISELHHLALSLWPIYTATLPPHLEMALLGTNSGSSSSPEPDNPPPPLNVNIKLLTDLKSQLSLSLASAIEDLLPRHIGSTEFVKALLPGPGKLRTLPKPPEIELPTLAKYLLVAAYAASYNPAKSDIRLFGRGTGPDGKRKKGGGTRRAGYGRTRVGKVPQRLLGPKPFPIDRLLALFSSLYAEHAPRPDDLLPSLGEGYNDYRSSSSSSSDSDGRDEMDIWGGRGGDAYLSVAQLAAKAERKRKRENERERRWDDEVDGIAMSAKLWSMIPQLESQGLLRRTSPQDRLDNITLRCEIDYEAAKTLAKELRITLDEYLYEASM
ncbi:origin recognition complex subunit 5 [Kwoniella heveanensis CBS 569]|nr:origin recognition complex subunit 5 [Kwoniella heveanensis CBS 569]